MNADRICKFLEEGGLGHASTHFADGTYGIPKLSYIVGAFREWWARKLAERGLGTWETKWDCDDFAATFFVDARWAHYASRKSKDESLAVGVIYFEAGARAEGGGGGGHAINVAVVEDDLNGESGAEAIRLVFLEPQYLATPDGPNPVLNLTPAERKSCWFVNF